MDGCFSFLSKSGSNVSTFFSIGILYLLFQIRYLINRGSRHPTVAKETSYHLHLPTDLEKKDQEKPNLQSIEKVQNCW